MIKWRGYRPKMPKHPSRTRIDPDNYTLHLVHIEELQQKQGHKPNAQYVEILSIDDKTVTVKYQFHKNLFYERPKYATFDRNTGKPLDGTNVYWLQHRHKIQKEEEPKDMTQNKIDFTKPLELYNTVATYMTPNDVTYLWNSNGYIAVKCNNADVLCNENTGYVNMHQPRADVTTNWRLRVKKPEIKYLISVYNKDTGTMVRYAKDKGIDSMKECIEIFPFNKYPYAVVVNKFTGYTKVVSKCSPLPTNPRHALYIDELPHPYNKD